jgi:hypothetical protein
MKTKAWNRIAGRWAVLMGGLLLSHWLWASDAPAISAIRLEGSGVAVVVQVPAGIKKVTLECRARLGAGAWVPRALARLEGNGGELVFRLPKSERMEMLRVRGDAGEPLPSFFYRGTNSFAGQITYLEGTPGSGWGGNIRFGNVDLATGPGVVPFAGEPAPSSREVVEADIWKIRGDTLFFFNQYRGLQVIDIRDPDAARVRGSLPLPAAGEDLYLLGDHHVVLLARDPCGQWWNGDAESRILLVNVEPDTPRIVASLPVKGQIRESRLVGTALYVAADTYQAVTPDTHEFGTLVSAFDLAQPAAPVTRGTLWFAGSEHTIAATDVFLFVATGTPENYWRSELHGIDITAPDGTLREYASVRTAGRIADKFKLNWADGVLAAVSETAPMNGSSTWLTRLETFSFPHPASAGPLGVVKLGEVELGHGERLFATRFDGPRVYVVTYRQVDPLWVVDLSDPARPRIAGELQVPGWSTYLHPLGDRLVTMGIDDVNGRRASVSLFDVHDAAAPRLLSRVSLGDHYSWSEANQNEKAFKVLTEQGLILVPFESAGGPQVQLIDLQPDSLQARGAIEHTFQPRRATYHRDRVLSLSGLELLSVDVADRDHPQVKAEIGLAWAVDQVFVQGNYLIELSFGPAWGDSAEATLRVTPADAPDTVLTQLVLTNRLPISGAAVKDGKLYVVQQRADYGWWIVPLSPTSDPPSTTNPPSLVLSVIDLQSLPELEFLGEAAVEAAQGRGGNSTKLLWPKPGLLVLANAETGYPWPWYGWGFDIRLPVIGVPSLVDPSMPISRWYWGWGGNSGRLTAFSVHDPGAPRLLSTLDLSGTNQWWSFSEAFAADGRVFLSHQGGESTIIGTNYHVIPDTTYLTSTNIQTITNITWLTPDEAVTNIVTVTNVVQVPVTTNVTNEVPMLRWDLRYYLNVVDYADPQEPTRRPPVNLPGTLRGLAHDGALLYTVGYHWNTETNGVPDGGEWLDASAYDGVEVHLVDSLELPQTWPQPLLVKGVDVFLGRASATNASESLLESWGLSNEGRFTRQSEVKLLAPAEQLADFGSLLAVQAGGELKLFNVADSASPALLSSGHPPGCLGMNLPSANGAVDRGLWVPLSTYGVWRLPVPQGR